MIFVDSSAWFAVHALRDSNHSAAARTLRTLGEQFVTSDYIIDETLTLLRVRGEQRQSLVFGKRVVDGGWARIVAVTDADFAAAWKIFQRYNDKEWSFTDGTSFVLMQRLGIQRAFAFDDHFRQFGTVTVLP